MTSKEKQLVEVLSKKKGWENVQVTRRSDREFDLGLNGKSGNNTTFSAWLPLASIGALTEWTTKEVAQHTNYPDMCMEGDWSGMRDSDNENIWFVFENFVAKSF